MKITLLRIGVVLGALMLWVTTVAAQADCPTIVQHALDVAGTACETTGRNQACYGNISLNAVPRDGVSNFVFKQAGDTVNVADVQSLTLSSLDAASQQWGVALMKIQANLPDTLPGQNVTLVLFGDVQIQDAADVAEATATPAAGGTTTVPAPQTSGPMQAFFFRSGVNDRPCAEAPDSGILIQSPQGAATINLSVNGVDITLGSTAYLQAQANGDMDIYVVEGHGTASAFNKTVTIPAGTWVSIPIGADLRATGAPGDPTGYDPRKLRGLPIGNLPIKIDPVPPLPDGDIHGLNTPPAGSWMLTYDQDYIDVGCAADDFNGGYDTDLTYDADGTMEWNDITLLPIGYGVYQSLPNPGATDPRIFRMAVTSATQIEGTLTWIVSGCATIVNNFHLVLDKASP